MSVRSWLRVVALTLPILCGCAATPTTPAGAPQSSPPAPTQASSPDPARVYADYVGRTEDFARVVRAPKEYEGRSIVLYGIRSGDLRPIEGRFSMPLAATDGKTVINAVDRPASNQFYLVVVDDFAREARERKLLSAGARGPAFVECKLDAQTTGRTTHYPCEIVGIVVLTGDRVSDSLWRTRTSSLEYRRY